MNASLDDVVSLGGKFQADPLSLFHRLGADGPPAPAQSVPLLEDDA